MPFVVPEMPLAVNIFTGPTHAGPPRVSTHGNLAYGKRVNVMSTGGTGTFGVPAQLMSLLLPALTDVRGPLASSGADAVECPAGSGRVYLVTFVDDIGKGFINEHRIAQLEQTAQPTPLP